jgi:hypothetical protein
VGKKSVMNAPTNKTERTADELTTITIVRARVEKKCVDWISAMLGWFELGSQDTGSSSMHLQRELEYWKEREEALGCDEFLFGTEWELSVWTHDCGDHGRDNVVQSKLGFLDPRTRG